MFIEKLERSWAGNKSLACVGLDPEPKKFPAQYQNIPNKIFEFNRRIIDATADLVCAFKPQIAHYSAVGAEADLEKTIQYIHDQYPELIVILDAKRGDIGSTAEMYAREAFDRYKADAVTLNPYLGEDSIRPFLDRKNKGAILLCKTSNPGSKDLQDLSVGHRKLYQEVAHQAATKWNTNGNVVLVVGSTYPSELADVRSLVGDMPFLVPGIGAQGGDIKATVQNGMDSRQNGMIISSSRAILYASQGSDFVDAARTATLQMRDEINRYRTK